MIRGGSNNGRNTPLQHIHANILSTVPLADFSQDEYSVSLLRQYSGDQTLTPVVVSADGNCFFNAVSVALFGTERHALQLRLRCCIYFAQNLDEMSDNSWADMFAPDFQDDVTAVTTPGGWMSIRTFKAVANITGTTVESLYLPVNGHCDKASRQLNTTFRPTNNSNGQRIFIMWSRTAAAEGNTWCPNHFVPLLCSTAPDTEAIVLSPNSPTQVPDSSLDESSHERALPTSPTPVPDCSLEESSHNHALPDHVPCVAAECSMNSPSGDELQGTLHGSKFLPTEELLRLLRLDVPGLAGIPNGIKENCYFVVNNTDNSDRRSRGKRSIFDDDCGAWKSAACGTPALHYIGDSSSELVYIRRLRGKYGKKVRGEFVELNRQPDDSEVLTVHHSYSTLQHASKYKRRVTWLEGAKSGITRKLAVVEYSGTFPVDRAEHGNSAVAGQEYVHSKRKVIDDIDEQLLHTAKRPHDIYQSMTAANPDDGSRNMRQVHNRKAHVQRQQQPHHRANLADEVQIVMCKLNEDKFVRSVYATADKPPCAVVCDDRQRTFADTVAVTVQHAFLESTVRSIWLNAS